MVNILRISIQAGLNKIGIRTRNWCIETKYRKSNIFWIRVSKGKPIRVCKKDLNSVRSKGCPGFGIDCRWIARILWKSSIFFATTGKCNFSLFSPIGFIPLTLFCFTFVCVPFMSIKIYFKSKKTHFFKSICCDKVTIFTSVYDVSWFTLLINFFSLDEWTARFSQ